MNDSSKPFDQFDDNPFDPEFPFLESNENPKIISNSISHPDIPIEEFNADSNNPQSIDPFENPKDSDLDEDSLENITFSDASNSPNSSSPIKMSSNFNNDQLSDPDDFEDKTMNELLKLVPWTQVFLIFMVILGDSVAINIISPFIPEISRNRFHIDEENLGIASGALVAAFLFSSFLSTFFIGSLSDRIGRKPLILIGLFTSSISSILFVVAPNFWTALFLRVFAGITNANIVLSFSGLSDLITGPPRSIVFAYLGAVFASGRSFSSFVGGITSGVYISFLPDHELLGKNPYLLPGLIGCIFNLLTFIFSLLFLQESNKNSKKSEKATVKKLILVGTNYLRSDKILRKLSIIYWVNSFCNGSQILLLILYVSLNPKLNGFGFNPTGIGILLGIMGLSGAVYQIVFGKNTILYLGVENTYRLGTFLLGFSAILFPIVGMLSHWSDIPTEEFQSNGWVWCGLVIAVITLSIGFMSGLPILSSILSNVIPQNLQGTLQGFVRSFSSLARASGPFLAGVTFSVLSHYALPGFTYIIVITGYTFCFFAFSKLKDPRFSGKKLTESVNLDSANQNKFESEEDDNSNSIENVEIYESNNGDTGDNEMELQTLAPTSSS